MAQYWNAPCCLCQSFQHTSTWNKACPCGDSIPKSAGGEPRVWWVLDWVRQIALGIGELSTCLETGVASWVQVLTTVSSSLSFGCSRVPDPLYIASANMHSRAKPKRIVPMVTWCSSHWFPRVRPAFWWHGVHVDQLFPQHGVYSKYYKVVQPGSQLRDPCGYNEATWHACPLGQCPRELGQWQCRSKPSEQRNLQFVWKSCQDTILRLRVVCDLQMCEVELFDASMTVEGAAHASMTPEAKWRGLRTNFPSHINWPVSGWPQQLENPWENPNCKLVSSVWCNAKPLHATKPKRLHQWW